MPKGKFEKLNVDSGTYNIVDGIVNFFSSSACKGAELADDLQSPIALPNGWILEVEEWQGERKDADINTNEPKPDTKVTEPFIEQMLIVGNGFSMVTGKGESTRAVKFSIKKNNPTEIVESTRTEQLGELLN